MLISAYVTGRRRDLTLCIPFVYPIAGAFLWRLSALPGAFNETLNEIYGSDEPASVKASFESARRFASILAAIVASSSSIDRFVVLISLTADKAAVADPTWTWSS